MIRRLPLRRLIPLLALLTVLGATAAAYSPGLSGPFLLDDANVLSKLGAYGPVDNPTTFVSYVTAGITGPTGRPLSMASFLMDARSWPAAPWPFKLTNLLLHLLNGVLLALLLRLLSRAWGLEERRAAWAGVLGAGLWLLHPLFVSTTLYVVQRMAELAALFVLAGLCLYARGRERLAAGRRRRGYALMTAGIVGGAGLGVFAKENAALLPMLAGVLEITVFAAADRRAASRPPARGFRWTLLGLPSLAIFLYLAWQLRHPWTPLPARGFSVAGRALTEPRVLVDYLYLLVIPHGGTGGLFTTVSVSHGLLHPWTTLPALLAVVGLVGAALLWRRRWPALAAALLFFFAGQALESSTVPLELYFEHRNYLPAVLLFWPLALWVLAGPGRQRFRTGAGAVLLAVLGLLTAYRAALWGDGVRLSLTWMRLDADSPRALVWGAEGLIATNRPDLALRALRRASRRMPDNVSIALSRLQLACGTGRAEAADLAAAVHAAGHAQAGSDLIYDAVGRLARQITQTPCPPFGQSDLQMIPSAALSNPHLGADPGLRQEFLVLRGRLFLHAHQPEAAYRAFTAALTLDPGPDAALVAAAELYAAHAPRLGLALLAEYRRLPRPAPRGWTMVRLHRWWLHHIGWYRDSFRRVRAALEQELAHRAGPAAR